MYSLRKCHRILKDGNRIYRRKWSDCEPAKLRQFEDLLQSLDRAILDKSRADAHENAVDLETFVNEHFAPSGWAKTKDLIIAITFALIIALLIRQVFMEHMHIPSGSMRPSFKEGDYLLVSKSRYGVNVPLQPAHLFFDPSLVNRMEPIVFSSDNLDVNNSDQRYFGFIPAKLQLIKRVVGRPGDTLWFYGGKIWGIDKEGRELTELREAPETAHLEYIPFLHYGDMLDVRKKSYQHMGIQLSADELRESWGMGNYAMARLLTREQMLQAAGPTANRIANGTLYLELIHSPRFSYNRLPFISPQKSYLPLNQEQLSKIMRRMSTSRFWVHQERVYRSKNGVGESARNAMSYPGLENGCYEIDRGRPLQIAWGNHAKRLPKDHTLVSHSPENIQRLFNTGIDLCCRCDPAQGGASFPARYAYFRDGGLCIFGETIVENDDPVLEEFLDWEEWLEDTQKGYRAFVDRGAPVTSRGHIDHDYIAKHGLRVPEGHYLLLGDNHAVSRDSRIFGFVPEANLRGSPTGIIWPWNSRKGTHGPEASAWFTLPWLFTWGSLTLGAVLCYSCGSFQRRRPLYKKLSP